MDENTLRELHEINAQLGVFSEQLNNINQKLDNAITIDTERLNRHSGEIDDIKEELGFIKGAMSGKSEHSNLMISIAIAVGPIAAVLISKYL